MYRKHNGDAWDVQTDMHIHKLSSFKKVILSPNTFMFISLINILPSIAIYVIDSLSLLSLLWQPASRVKNN